jgi:anti-anti-sigma factor
MLMHSVRGSARQPGHQETDITWQSIGTAGVGVTRYPGALVIYFRADIDAHNYGRLMDFCSRALESTERIVTVMLDFSGVTYLDSGGLRGLESFCRNVTAKGGTYRIVAPTGSIVRRLLDIVNPESLLTGSIVERLVPPIAGAGELSGPKPTMAGSEVVPFGPRL